MKLKELYLENKEHRYNTITRVKKENITLEMDPVKKIQDNWIILLGILVVIIKAKKSWKALSKRKTTAKTSAWFTPITMTW